MNNPRKFALVTGSARGLGRATALALAADGLHIAIHYNTSEADARKTAEAVRQFGVEALLVQGDLTKPNEVERIFQLFQQPDHQLAVLIQNVGNYLKKSITTLEVTEWDDIINSNLNATFYCNRIAAGLMQQQGYGRIVNIGFASLGSIAAKPLITPYYIAKTGVLLLTKSLAAELAAHGVTVNMVSPGVLETSISQPIHEIPAGRLGTLDEIVKTIRFLIADGNEYITGTNIEVAGGWRL